jgi:hypothetical protein
MIGVERVAAKAVESGGKLSVKSALNPILWLCAIVSIPSLIAAIIVKTPPIWLILLVLLPVCTAIFGFLFLLVFDRDKLQSEDYQIRNKSLDLMQIKGQRSPELVDPENIDTIRNPEIPKIENTEEEEK